MASAFNPATGTFNDFNTMTAADLNAGMAAAVTRAQFLAGPIPVVPVTAVVVDEFVLRSFGAFLDGVNDDLPAYMAALAAARSLTPAPISIPVVAFKLPAGASLVSGPITSPTATSVSFHGAGANLTTLIMKSGGAGAIVHGTTTIPATGFFQLTDITIQDGNTAGSGSVGLSLVFDPAAIQPAMLWRGVALRQWSQPAQVTNVTRNWHCSNVVIFGPNFTMQTSPAINYFATRANTTGNFTNIFIDVFIANYMWGWRYNIATPTEGQRFYSCSCYNGWGMVQAYCSPSSNPPVAYYQSIVWYFTDCDWQGYGYAIDLTNLRNVVVRGGYYTTNTPPAGMAIPPALGDSTNSPRPRRRVMSFAGCGGVTLDRVAFDYGETDATVSFCYVDYKSQHFRAVGTQILALSNMYCAWEYQAGNTANQCSAQSTFYNAWGTGPKIIDAGLNQLCQDFLLDNFLGDVSDNGRVTLYGHATGLTTNSSSQIAVTFPVRPDGGAYFRGGAPMVTFNSLNSSVGVPAGSLISITATGFVVAFVGSGAGLTVDIMYSASGY